MEKWISGKATISGTLSKEKSGSSEYIFRLLYKWSNRQFYMCCGKGTINGIVGIKHPVLSIWQITVASNRLPLKKSSKSITNINTIFVIEQASLSLHFLTKYFTGISLGATQHTFFTHWCSVTKLCPTLRNPMNCSMPGFPVPHHLQSLPKFMSIESVMQWTYSLHTEC